MGFFKRKNKNDLATPLLIDDHNTIGVPQPQPPSQYKPPSHHHHTLFSRKRKSTMIKRQAHRKSQVSLSTRRSRLDSAASARYSVANTPVSVDDWRYSVARSSDTTDVVDNVRGYSYESDGSDYMGYQERYLQEHQYGGDVNAANNKVEEEEEDKSMTPITMLKITSVLLLTCGGVVSYLTAFVASITASTATVTTVGIAGGVFILITPWVWLNEWRLVRYPSLRSRVNELRDDADRLRRQMEILALEEEELREEIGRMQLGNEELDRLANKQGANVDELVGLVRENRLILDQMKVCVSPLLVFAGDVPVVWPNRML